ncbi:MAG: hypothetical protein L0I76_06385 [Pseudonocardia sp.]|nr:hypothetical protein [Pseudonocardia sp.]
MTATNTTPDRLPAPARRLRPGTRKAVLAAHLISMGAWIGIDIVLAVLIVTGLLAAPGTAAIALQALPLLLPPMLIASLVCLVSGLILAVCSRYGIVRHWWVAIKLAINVVFSTLIVVALWPGVDDAAEHGRNLAAGVPDAFTADQILYPPIVSPTGLVLAVLLAGYKPWGRIRRRRIPARSAP